MKLMYQTKRMTIRRFHETDLNDYFAIVSNRAISKVAGCTPANGLFEARFMLTNAVNDPMSFAIESNDDHTVIGSLGFYQRNTVDGGVDASRRDLGYMLNEDYWNQGYMGEAVQIMVDNFFVDSNFDELCASYLTKNAASAKILEVNRFTPRFAITHHEWAVFGAGETEQFCSRTRNDTIKPIDHPIGIRESV